VGALGLGRAFFVSGIERDGLDGRGGGADGVLVIVSTSWA
jgi:hypothetical protein